MIDLMDMDALAWILMWVGLTSVVGFVFQWMFAPPKWVKWYYESLRDKQLDSRSDSK